MTCIYESALAGGSSAAHPAAAKNLAPSIAKLTDKTPPPSAAPRLALRAANYALAAHERHQWPTDVGAEVAFAGRSNVGKSSAINAITQRRGLARASKTPGRTQQIVFFDVDEAHRLVDLPGYGYAKAPLDLRRRWGWFVRDYVTSRACLKGLVVPMDIRRPLTELDQTMLRYCREVGLPMHILLTKADKLKRGAATAALLKTRAAVAAQPTVSVQLFSAVKRQGIEAAAAVVADWLLG